MWLLVFIMVCLHRVWILNCTGYVISNDRRWTWNGEQMRICLLEGSVLKFTKTQENHKIRWRYTKRSGDLLEKCIIVDFLCANDLLQHNYTCTASHLVFVLTPYQTHVVSPPPSLLIMEISAAWGWAMTNECLEGMRGHAESSKKNCPYR